MTHKHVFQTSLKLAIGVAAVELLAPFSVAQIIPETEYATWGITSTELAVPAGSIITDAVLTVKGVSPSNAAVEVYLLDNPAPGYTQNPKENDSNSVFAGLGTPLAGTLENGDLVCRLGQPENNSTQSWVWKVFPYPFNFLLPKNKTLIYTSSLLELMDYAGTDVSFGFGIESAENIPLEFISLELMITISSYQTPAADKILIYSYTLGSSDTVKTKNPNAAK
jgi:hypothetical protein